MKITIALLFFLTSYSLFISQNLWAANPTVDSLIVDMVSSDLQKRGKAKNQLVKLCRENSADILIPYLTSSKRANRLASLEITSLIDNTDQTIDYIAKSLSDSESSVRLRASEALAHIGTSEAIGFLVEGISEERDLGNLSQMLYFLGGAGQEIDGAIFLKYIKHDSLQVRFAASQALWNLKPGNLENSVATICSRETDLQVKAYLLAYLVSQDHESGNSLKDYASVQDHILRTLVIEAYASADNIEIVSSWIELMSHESWHVRLDAARGCEALALPGHIPSLIKFLEDPHPDVRDVIALGLRRISKNHFGFQGHEENESRARAVKRWQAWWQENSYRFDKIAP